MPTIELTDEQADELSDALKERIDTLDRRLRKFTRPDDDPDVIQVRHVQSVLSDIIHLLEIA
jgi:phosphoglycerate-specific signal transduction histidine kinase